MTQMALTRGSTNQILNGICTAKSVGRPSVADPTSERSTKPWLAEGISPRTYYRRKAEAALTAAPAPQQSSAHVIAWIATLSAIERLEYRAVVRRCLRVKAKPAVGRSLLELYMRGIGVN